MKIECDKCGNVMRVMNPISVANGRIGGMARVQKGFACQAVQMKAQATRKANRKETK